MGRLAMEPPIVSCAYNTPIQKQGNGTRPVLYWKKKGKKNIIWVN
jgi:hypothetical protein